METIRCFIDLAYNSNYIEGTGELERTPFMTGAILQDDSDAPLYKRRRFEDLGDTSIGVVGLGRRWRMKDGQRVGKAYSMLVQVEIFGVGVTTFEVNKSIEVSVDGETVRPLYGCGELCGRSLSFELHPPKKEESGETWRPAFLDIGPKLYNPFAYTSRTEEVPLADVNLKPMTAEDFFPYD